MSHMAATQSEVYSPSAVCAEAVMMPHTHDCPCWWGNLFCDHVASPAGDVTCDDVLLTFGNPRL